MKKVLIALLVITSLTVSAQESVLLRLNYTKGDSFLVTTESKQSMGAQGGMNMKMTMGMIVTKVAEENIKTESMITSLVSGLIVASGFYLGAFLMSFAANISLNFYYFSALFGYVARLIYIFGFLLLFRNLYPIDEMAMSLTVPIVFLSMLFLEMAMVIKRKDTDLDWANDNSS